MAWDDPTSPTRRAAPTLVWVGIWAAALTLGCVPLGGGGSGDGGLPAPESGDGAAPPMVDSGGDSPPPAVGDAATDGAATDGAAADGAATDGAATDGAAADSALDDAGQQAPDGQLAVDHGAPDRGPAGDGGPPDDGPLDGDMGPHCGCGDRVCGPDGCGGSCGDCPAGSGCTPAGLCEPAAACGDGQCQPDEGCARCPADCGACCGDGVCTDAHGEHCGTCPADCGCPEGMPCDAQAGVCQCEDRCSGGDRLVCVDGPAWLREPCPHGCDPRRVECYPLCEPGGRPECIEGEMVYCDEGGDRWVPDPKCPDGCADGRCRPPIICEPQARCVDHDALYVCAADGRSERLERCEFGCRDDDGPARCRPPCEVGQTRCVDDGRFERCRPDESGWGPAEACPDICVLAEDRCGASGACRPGDWRCGEGGRHICDDQGAGFQLSPREEHQCGRFCFEQIAYCAFDNDGFVGEDGELLWAFGPDGWGAVTAIDGPGRRAACATMGYGLDDANLRVVPGAHADALVRYTVDCGREVASLGACAIEPTVATDGIDLRCPTIDEAPFDCRGDGVFATNSLYRRPDGSIRPVRCRRSCSGRFCSGVSANCTEPGVRCDVRPGERISVRFLSDDRPGEIDIEVDEPTPVRLVGHHNRGENGAPCQGETTLTINGDNGLIAVVGPAPCARFEAELLLPAGDHSAILTTTGGREHSVWLELSIVW